MSTVTEPGEMINCSNCQQDIAAANFVMHEVHCRRNIILCPKCKEPVPRSKLDDHEEEEHAHVPCKLCNKSFEKNVIDSHVENCPRRPSQCAYCEIECPRDELEKHIEYCGTRTEQCHKCSQFIMHKDLVKHEDSNCSYPEVKGLNSNVGSQNNRVFQNEEAIHNGRYGLSDFRSSFVRGELDRFLTTPGTGSHATVPNTASNIAAAIRPQNNKPKNVMPQNRKAPDVVKKRNPISSKTSNYHSTRLNVKDSYLGIQSSRNRDPCSNISASRNSSSTITAHAANYNQQNNNQESMDDVLAMQLASNLNLNIEDRDDHLLAEQIGKSTNTKSVASLQVNASDRSSPDEPMIPCEYCGEAYPLTSLLQHQTNCDTFHETSSYSSQVHNNEVPRTNMPSRSQWESDIPILSDNILNNSSTAVAENGRGQLNMIDNLAFVQDSDWHPSESMLNASETMFPCEFCGDTFPEDIFIQHESVCDDNPFKTPRVMTPKVTNAHMSDIRRLQNPDSPAPIFNRLTTQSRSTGMNSRYPQNGVSKVTNNTRSGMITPEARRVANASKSRSVLNEFIHNPSYTPVNLSNGDSNTGSKVAVNRTSQLTPGGNIKHHGYSPSVITRNTTQQTNRPQPVVRRNFDASGLGDSSRVSGRNLQTDCTSDNSRTNIRAKIKRPQRDA